MDYPSLTRDEIRVDHGLSALLVIQCLTLFVAIPLGASYNVRRVS